MPDGHAVPSLFHRPASFAASSMQQQNTPAQDREAVLRAYLDAAHGRLQKAETKNRVGAIRCRWCRICTRTLMGLYVATKILRPYLRVAKEVLAHQVWQQEVFR